jgi:hypothetical protein
MELTMNLKRFTIVNENESLQTTDKTSILINLEHIVSIKPIKLSMKNQEVIDGYWIRLSNGKKYRAIQVPKIILDSLNETLPAIQMNDEAHSFNYQ